MVCTHAGTGVAIRAEAERTASSGTEITMQTAAFGVAYIETRFEALIGAYASAQLAGQHHAGHDAVIVAAFGDPGLAALREALPVPVLGLTESALASACLLGNRFSITRLRSLCPARRRRGRCRSDHPGRSIPGRPGPQSARAVAGARGGRRLQRCAPR